MDCNVKKLGQPFQVFNTMPAKLTGKIIALTAPSPAYEICLVSTL